MKFCRRPADCFVRLSGRTSGSDSGRSGRPRRRFGSAVQKTFVAGAIEGCRLNGLAFDFASIHVFHFCSGLVFLQFIKTKTNHIYSKLFTAILLLLFAYLFVGIIYKYINVKYAALNILCKNLICYICTGTTYQKNNNRYTTIYILYIIHIVKLAKTPHCNETENAREWSRGPNTKPKHRHYQIHTRRGTQIPPS